MHAAQFRIASIGRGVTISLASLGLAVGGYGTASAVTPGVDPQFVSQLADPGASFSLHKVVHTPAIPPNPDIVFLADTTGSMGAAIANVKAEMSTITTTVLAAQPTAQFAVVSYKDEPDGAGLF